MESRSHIELALGCIVVGFGLGGRDVTDGLQKPAVVEPVHPLQGGEFNRFERAPRPTPPDHLRLVEAVDRLRESVVVGIPDAADGRLNACFGETFGVPN